MKFLVWINEHSKVRNLWICQKYFDRIFKISSNENDKGLFYVHKKN